MKRIIQVSSGRGPIECQWVVMAVANLIIKEAKEASILEDEINQNILKKPMPSVNVSLDGSAEVLDEFFKEWSGTIKWTGQSRFRPNHKRKNWFVACQEIFTLDHQDFSPELITYETINGTGKGGQHVNKNQNCVRAYYPPLGLQVVSRDERSLKQNKAKAVKMLKELYERNVENQSSRQEEENWSNHNLVERGRAIKTFQGVVG